MSKNYLFCMRFFIQVVSMQQKQQLDDYGKHLDKEISFHEDQIKAHQDALKRHKEAKLKADTNVAKNQKGVAGDAGNIP